MTNELKVLQELQWELDCSKTSMPRDYVPRTKFTDKTANGLTKCIIAWIKLNGGQAERISTTGRYLQGKEVNRGFYGVVRTKGQYIPGTSTKGSADISATIKGKSVKIEVKVGKDRQSEEQKKYQKDIENAGGIYVTAKDFKGFLEWYSRELNKDY